MESLALGLLTIETVGPDTFEEVLEGYDCPAEAPPYLPTQPFLTSAGQTFTFDTPWRTGRANFFPDEIFLSDLSAADTAVCIYTQWWNAAVSLELAAGGGRPWGRQLRNRQKQPQLTSHQLVNLHNFRISTEIDTP